MKHSLDDIKRLYIDIADAYEEAWNEGDDSALWLDIILRVIEYTAGRSEEELSRYDGEINGEYVRDILEKNKGKGVSFEMAARAKIADDLNR